MRRFLLCLGLSAAGCQATPADTARYHNQEGVARLAKQDYLGAKQQFESALANDPKNVDALQNLATACVQSGNVGQAEKSYKAALALDPDRAACRHGLGVLLMSHGRGGEAAALVKDWAQKKPDSPDALAEWGWLDREMGDLPAAQAKLQRALELDANHVRALVEMGLLYEAFRYPDRAKSLYEQALARDPSQTEAQARLAALRRDAAPARKDG